MSKIGRIYRKTDKSGRVYYIGVYDGAVVRDCVATKRMPDLESCRNVMAACGFRVEYVGEPLHR